MDFRALLLSLVKDLLAVAHQPAWPAAPFLLLRFAAMLQARVRGLGLGRSGGGMGAWVGAPGQVLP